MSERPEDRQACAHAQVRYRTRPTGQPDGSVFGQWECTTCATQFYPRPQVLGELEEARTRLAAAEEQATLLDLKFAEACQELQAARRALEVYGVHLNFCERHHEMGGQRGPCTCGLMALLAPERPRES